MSIVDFNNCMKEYRELLRYLPPLFQRKCKASTNADWNTQKVTDDENRAATYDVLPRDYKTHINSQFELDWQDMDNNEFLDAMRIYKFIDNTRKFKEECRERKRKEQASKKNPNLKGDSESQGRKRPWARASTVSNNNQFTLRVKKFCQHCKDNYWTHNTANCYFKKPMKEANANEAVQKELDKVKNLIKNLKKRLDSDSDNE